MFRIDSEGATADKKFTDGNPSIPIPATEVSDDWLNAVQEELAAIVEDTGMELDKADNSQVLTAINSKIEEAIRIASITGYFGEFRNFYEQTPLSGWAVRNGALLSNVSVSYPALLAELQKPENAWKCITEAAWQTLVNTEPFNGEGGAAFFVVDTSADTIRLPDTRNMIMTDSGTFIAPGEAQGDAVRPATGALGSSILSTSGASGYFGTRNAPVNEGVLQPVGTTTDNRYYTPSGSNTTSQPYGITFDISRAMTVASEVRSKRFGGLGCVYIGGN